VRGWRRFALAFGAGLISALAFAPTGIFPALLFAFAILILLIDGAACEERRLRAAAFAGWSFGFGQFLAGLYWVGYAFTVDASAHAWQIPFVALLLPGGLALFPAVACAVCVSFWRPGSARIFLFGGAYAACEWLRGHIFTGFPWNLPAYAWGASPAIMQSAAAMGAYGLSLLTILLGASLAEFAGSRPISWRLPATLVLLFSALWIGGELRLTNASAGYVPGVRLRLVQPNVAQSEKYLPQFRARNWARLVDLSTTPSKAAPTHIIWPEAAPPFLLTHVPEAMEQIAALTRGSRVLMTGAVRAIYSPDGSFRAYNSLLIISHDGQLLGTYDKFHLVPFGEYLPFPRLLHALGITKLVDMPDGFGRGPGPLTFKLPGAPPAGPLICYEIAFPGEVAASERPGWFVNVTDDSWFGPSSGPYQHLLMARLRAIEEGIPVARAANTGISAVIDPMGRVVARLGLGKTGIVDAGLPAALPTTPYARLGDIGFALLLAVSLLWGLTRSGHEAKRRPKEPPKMALRPTKSS
jgi:apolipoprotein N-acyltransferase